MFLNEQWASGAERAWREAQCGDRRHGEPPQQRDDDAVALGEAAREVREEEVVPALAILLIDMRPPAFRHTDF